MPATRDEEYAAVVERERPLIQATAYLLTGDPVRAERVVQLVFAQLYGRWPGLPHPRIEALRAVVRAARAPVHLPWEDRERVELIDGPSACACRRAASSPTFGCSLTTSALPSSWTATSDCPASRSPRSSGARSAKCFCMSRAGADGAGRRASGPGE